MIRIGHVELDCVAGYATSIRAGHHSIAADEPVSNGGTDTGPSPFPLILAGLGACTAITLRMYSERKGWNLGAVHVELSMTRDGEATRIQRTISFSETLAPEQRTRIAEIAAKTPVTKLLRAGSTIETEIRDSKGT
jgi:putative redox protein